MKKLMWLLLVVAAITLVVASCPREEGKVEGDRPSTRPASAEPAPAPSEEPETAAPAEEEPATAEADEEAAATEEIEEELAATEETEPVEEEEAKAAEDEEVIEPEENPCEPAETEEEQVAEPTDDNVVNVVFETTEGKFVIAVYKEWAPIGARHFLMLVEEGYYDGAPFFRVVADFMAQAGFSGNHDLTAKYLEQRIDDDPQVTPNRQYTVSHGHTGERNSRGTHIFINLVDNSAKLDSAPVPYPPFGEVIEGKEVVDNIFITGENPRDLQGILRGPGGIEEFKARYPQATFINKVYIQR